MRFATPQFLWLLLALPCLFVFYLHTWRVKRKVCDLFAANAGQKGLLSLVSYGRQQFRAMLMMGVVFFSILALARPQWGFEWQEVRRKGVDIVVVMDVSKSMLATDIKPNRLERAKKEIQNLIKIMRGDRIGLVSFAGSAFVLCPLTLDYGTARMLLDQIDVGSIPLGGTDIGRAIRKGIEAFDPASQQSRVLIVITDGEDHENTVLEAADAARDARVVIYPIAAGRPEGAPIPMGDDKGQIHYLKDDKGQLILSRQNFELLQSLAHATQGQIGSIGSSQFSLADIYRLEIDKLEKKEFAEEKIRRYEERFLWPLFVAFLLYVWESMFDETQRRRRFLLSKKGTTLAVMTGWMLLSGIFSTGFRPIKDAIREGNQLYENRDYESALEKYHQAQTDKSSSATVLYNMGNALYQLERYDEAADMYQSALPKAGKDLLAKLKYNTGNIHFRQGRFEDALRYYKEALDLAPHDEDIQHNIEFTQLKIEEMEQQAQDTAEKSREEQQRQEEQNDSSEGQQENTTQDERQSQEQNASQDTQASEQSDAQAQQSEQQADQGQNEETSQRAAEAQGEGELSSMEEAKRLLEMIADEELKGVPIPLMPQGSSRSREIEKDW